MNAAKTQQRAASPQPSAEGLLQRKCACGTHAAGGACRTCSSRGADAAPAELFRGSGAPLDGTTRRLFEPRFGRDLSRVRVHAGSDAADAARRQSALAFTSGTDIGFAAGHYAPRTSSGLQLLAHELAHVAQQSQGEVATPSNRAALERDADRAARSPTPIRTIAGGPQRGSVQRFEEYEHRSLGNEASGGMKFKFGPDPQHQIELTYGDIAMLSGDWFKPDEILDFANEPGKDNRKPKSQDELVTALHEINRRYPQQPDARFAAGGVWASFKPNSDLLTAVIARFDRLAAENASHFVIPKGRNIVGQPNPSVAKSAGTRYREGHELAVSSAYEAGAGRKPIERAYALEAAAQHFLSDEFAGGHLRTPIEAIREYWGKKYPLFFFNLLEKMSLDTAIALNDQPAVGSIASVQYIYNSVHEEVKKKEKKLPAITLGDLVGRIFHDIDNKEGVEVGPGQKVFGDTHLDDKNPENATRKLAVAAMKAGMADLPVASDIAKSNGQMKTEDVFAEVRKRTNTPTPQTFFNAEVMTPQPTVTAPAQNWNASDLESLWAMPALGSKGAIVGARMFEAVAPGEPIHEKLTSIGNEFPVDKFPGLHPRRAYFDGFMNPLVKDEKGLKAGLLDIINWAPDKGLHWSDTDDVALSTGEAMNHAQMCGMTMEARKKYVRLLIDGYCAVDEQELVINLFRNAKKSDRPRLYELVEGHPWKGDWISGAFTRDDDIVDALTWSRLKILKDIINEPSSVKEVCTP